RPPGPTLFPYTTLFRSSQHLRRYAGGKCWSSEEERRVDALALRADERRDKLRKASGRSKYPLIRRCLNGETRRSSPPPSIRQSIDRKSTRLNSSHVSIS